jgi:hypothetical protein
MTRIAGRLAGMNGWTEEQVAALIAGTSTGDAQIDALTRLVRDAAAHSGSVSDTTWAAALKEGWSVEQVADAFTYVGATAFTGSFLNYAQTEMDV